jgi:2'-5' RNA ligase
LDGLRVVPSRRRARMLWAALLDPDGSCAALASAVARASLPFGSEPDERTYSPHVTLVRARRPHSLSETAFDAGAEALSNGPASMSVTRFTLYSSTLNSGAPVYAQLRSYTLET